MSEGGPRNTVLTGRVFVIMTNMYQVYIIQSEIDNRYYYGYTEKSVDERLAEHNSARSPHTSKYRP